MSVEQELTAIGAARAFIKNYEDDAIKQARREGLSFREIGEAIGISKQAVWKKHQVMKEKAS